MFYSEEDYYAERDSHLASPAEAIAEFAVNAGRDHPDQAWLSHDWDVWVKNPFYVGPPVPHPESDDGFEDEFVGPIQPRAPREILDDDIPF